MEKSYFGTFQNNHQIDSWQMFVLKPWPFNRQKQHKIKPQLFVLLSLLFIVQFDSISTFIFAVPVHKDKYNYIQPWPWCMTLTQFSCHVNLITLIYDLTYSVHLASDLDIFHLFI